MIEGYSSDKRGQVEASAPPFNANALVAAGIVVAALYLGREVLIPFVIAVLLSFVLALPVRMLQKLGLGRRFPVAIVVIAAFLGLFAIGGLVASQLVQLATDLPRYQTTITGKIQDLKGATGEGPFERVADMLGRIAQEFSGEAARSPAAPGGPETAKNEPKPVPVEITGTRASPLQTIAGYVTPLVHPLATIAIVAVFVVFILLQRSDLRNRLIRLAGSHDLQRTTAALNEAAERLSKFFLTQVLLNAGFGVVVGVGLWAIGVPSPILWGVMAAISRFVPYVGLVLAAGGPLLLAAAVDPNWSMLLYTAAFFMVIEFAVGQVVEPLLYGHSTGLSPIAVIASVTFWTWLWGAVGLIIATPLTVCLVVLGRHVDHLEFLDVMLGDRPPLTVAESFYQRVLAGDSGEVIEQAELFLKDHALMAYYDEVAVKGLALAQIDLTRGALDQRQLARVDATLGELLEDLSEHEDEVAAIAGETAEQKRADGDEDLDETLDAADRGALTLPVMDRDRLPPEWRGETAVLCVAGRNMLDRAGAQMLAQLLGKHGLGATVAGPEAFTAAGLLALPRSSEVKVVCLSFLDVSSPVHVRYAVRRLRRRLPGAKIVVGSWGIPEDQAGGLCENVTLGRLREPAFRGGRDLPRRGRGRGRDGRRGAAGRHGLAARPRARGVRRVSRAPVSVGAEAPAAGGRAATARPTPRGRDRDRTACGSRAGCRSGHGSRSRRRDSP
jgi:predicted PurR-regulated permease PerM